MHRRCCLQAASSVHYTTLSPETCWADYNYQQNLLLLHLVGCLYYCINDARSHKHQIRIKHLQILQDNKIIHRHKSVLSLQHPLAYTIHLCDQLSYWNAGTAVAKDTIWWRSLKNILSILPAGSIVSVLYHETLARKMLSRLKLLIKLLLLHLVGCLYYYIDGARSHKHEVHIHVYWNWTPSGLLCYYRRFGGIFCFHLHVC